MTVTRCALQLTGRGNVAGHAYVQGRNAAKAEQAETLCRALRAQDQDCIVVQR